VEAIHRGGDVGGDDRNNTRITAVPSVGTAEFELVPCRFITRGTK